MGRAPCCDKANVKKGPWSPEEDAKLKAYIEKNGTGGNWIALPQKIGLKRCGKSCRLRWLNYLRPNIKHGGFSEEEDNIICSLYINIGSRWSIIAAQLPGRTDNDIKNYWNTRLKKKFLGKQRKEQQARQASSCFKQEMKMESDQNYMVPAGFMMNQTLYWPELPFVMPPANSTQDPYHRDQASIKNLLIKLGGRFPDDHQQQPRTSMAAANYQNPFDGVFSQEQLYESTMSMLASSTPMNSMSSTSSPLPNTQYTVVGTGHEDLSQGLESFAVELSDMVYQNVQPLDGLESYYGMDMVNNGSTGTSTSVESTSWDDISSLVCPGMVSEYEACQQSMPQDPIFDDSRYFGPQ